MRFIPNPGYMDFDSKGPARLILYLQDVNRAGAYKAVWGHMLHYYGESTDNWHIPVQGGYAETTGTSNTNMAACTGIRFYASQGTITSAVFKIYGLAKS